MLKLLDRYRKLTVFLFFTSYLFMGLGIHRDYGVSWDEEINRNHGKQSLAYIKAKFTQLFLDDGVKLSSGVFASNIAEQGPFFEIILKAIESALGLKDIQAILRMRHLVTFMTFWCGSLAFYLLLKARFQDWRWAILGVTLLILTPRIFAHSFYNSKDTVLLAFFIIASYTLIRFIFHMTFLNTVWHAIACAAAIDIRIVGFILPLITLFLIGIEFTANGFEKATVLKYSTPVVIYLCLLIIFVILFWPQLWDSPWQNFLHMVQKLDEVRQFDNNYSLFRGRFIRVDQLPWYYLPYWMLITIPVSFILLFVAGLGISVSNLLGRPFTTVENKWHLIFLIQFFLPLFIVFISKPILYDGWRHFYFVYPAFLVIAIFGIIKLFSHAPLRKFVLLFLFMSLLHAGYSMVSYHPYQNVYFNFLAKKDKEKNYELDYWGLSFREGLDFVLGIDQANRIPIDVSDYPGILNSYILEKHERERLKYVPLQQATYFLSNHRHPQHFKRFRSGQYPYVNEIYSVKAGGQKLLGVYKLR